MSTNAFPIGSTSAAAIPSHSPDRTHSPDVQHVSSSQIWANRLLDASILATLFLAPLVLGGRHPVGELALILAVMPGCLALVWKTMLGEILPLRRVHWFLLAAALLIPLLQVTPLPAWFTETIAPGTSQLVPADITLFSGSQVPQTLSLSVWETRQSLPLGCALLAAFLCFATRLQKSEDVDRFVIWMVASGLLLAAVAILQATFDNGKFLWVYDHPSRETGNVPRGPFQNENHLCSLLASLLPCTLYLVFRDIQVNHRFGKPAVDFSKSFRSRTSQSTSRSHRHTSRRKSRKTIRSFGWSQWLAIAACIVIVSTVFATPSRGGIAIIAFAGITWLAFIGWSWLGIRLFSQVDYRKWMYAGLAGGTTLAAGAIVALFLMVDRVSHWRSVLWSADLEMWSKFPLLGVGLGNHRHAYHAFVLEYNPQTFSTAESSWLQLLTETGISGFLVALAIAAVCLLAAAYYAIHSRKGSPFLLGAAVFAGLAASCLHSVGDFPWHIPACMVVVLALAAVAIRLRPITDLESQETPIPPAPSPYATMLSTSMAGLLLLANLWGFQAALPPARAAQSWDQFRRLVRAESGEQTADTLAPEQSEEVLALLQATLRENPQDLLARTKLNCYLTGQLEKRQFEMSNPRAIAAHIVRQANFIANVCPAEARSYLCAATALAIQGGSLSAQEELLAQSQRLRPIDGRVALKRALNALLTSNEEEARRQFGIALNDDPASRAAAVQAVGLIYSLDQVVEIWQPDRPTSALLYNLARQEGDTQQRALVGRHYCRTLWDEAERLQNATGDLYLEEAFKVATQIGDHPLGLRIVSKRLETTPRNVSLLLVRAQLNYTMGDEAATLADLTACKNINPQDDRVRRFALRVDREAGLRVR